ncbi:multicopper oxidase domain-containing protein [Komagataeibacter oboediens]|uniref:multicopper oxidase domain-containing protein n=1 Tax=Komagataeibacter oboediens TaxID=65958 RepID=UPI0020C38E9D|nr:multicopper oxidase domain-containing protein [Komagataeibacter oboediens]
MMLDRRSFLALSGRTTPATMIPRRGRGAGPVMGGKADHTLRIATGQVELAPGRIMSTTLYNGQFPGPLLRLEEGRLSVIDIFNDTDTPELVHWHGRGRSQPWYLYRAGRAGLYRAEG